MKLFNVPLLDLTIIVSKISVINGYAGNIVFKNGPYQETQNCVNFTLTSKDSSAIGSRRSNTGRKITAACWHAHRDIMIEIFRQYPNARLKSAMADYRGQDDFLSKFPDTGSANIGSIATPLRADQACNCSDY